MKTGLAPHRRAFAALVPASLLIAAPALAQEAAAPAAAPPIQTTTVPPPPIAGTSPDTSAAPAQPQSAAPAANGTMTRNGIGDPNSATPIDPAAVAQAEAERADGRAAAARSSRPAPRVLPRALPRVAPRAAPVVTAAPTAVNAAPAASASAPAAAPTAPAAPTDVAPAPVVTPPVAEAPAATQTASDTVATTDRGTSIWPFVLGALVVLGGLVAFLLRRRHVADEVYDEVEPVYIAPAADPAPVEPVAVPARAEPIVRQSDAPLAAAPIADAVLYEEPAVATEEATLAEPEAEDIEALTAVEAPVADRPWLEFALRPVRAGSNVDEALVEIELTVGNSGNIAAEDVRISTFLFADGSASEREMERLLVERGDDGVDPVTIAPGEGTRVDATLALLKRDLAGEEFSPVVMADARYRLPDGSEGRTSATFSIGLVGDCGATFAPIPIARPLMHEEVEARLQGAPGHA